MMKFTIITNEGRKWCTVEGDEIKIIEGKTCIVARISGALPKIVCVVPDNFIVVRQEENG